MLGNHMLLLKNPVLDSILIKMFKGFPKGSAVKNSPANAGDTGLIPGSGRSPGEGNGNSLQNSCLENSMDRGACWATVHGLQRIRHNRAHINTHIESINISCSVGLLVINSLDFVYLESLYFIFIL